MLSFETVAVRACQRQAGSGVLEPHLGVGSLLFVLGGGVLWYDVFFDHSPGKNCCPFNRFEAERAGDGSVTKRPVLRLHGIGEIGIKEFNTNWAVIVCIFPIIVPNSFRTAVVARSELDQRRT